MGIKDKVISLKKKFGTNNPFELCEKLGIWVYIVPLGKVQGHYTYAKRKKVFFINENLSEIDKYFCCAHELGHALLHTRHNVYFNSSKTFFIQNKFENQANEFAAELLLDNSILEKFKGYSLEKISEYTSIDIKYLNLKFNKK
ncbi:ImmA/IrrE family metallo-endopeptidase [uncultured Clostridium sp.]|uniref:ImmA/IrrE family metallo-endopeptidase n=1 Tax=uncultured Clostridium sp. TaxID=59620 RepID=UPI002629E1AC|nr:ImmA/IrrE family metallo-endopeptidase [uncultured Clostridium sp.]